MALTDEFIFQRIDTGFNPDGFHLVRDRSGLVEGHPQLSAGNAPVLPNDYIYLNIGDIGSPTLVNPDNRDNHLLQACSTMHVAAP